MTAEMARMSWADVCARRLERHGLSTPFDDAEPADVVSTLCGVHAQVMSAAELSIAMRIAGGTRRHVRKALWTEHSLIKTYGPRGTVHILPARELPTWIGALAAAPPPRYSVPDHVRMTPAQTDDVLAAIADALADAELTIDELSDEVVARAGAWAGDLVMEAFQGRWPRWRQAMPLAGMRGILRFGPQRGRKVTYTSPLRRLPDLKPADGARALTDVVRSFLHVYGPATPQRFAQWMAAPPAWATELFDSLTDEIQPVEVEGTRAWVATGDLATPPVPPRGVRLLPYFDAYAYAVGNPRELLYPGRAAERAAGNFQVLLVDGVVGGVWHQRRSGRRVEITVEPLSPLRPAQRDELDEQVARLGEILEAAPTMTLGTVAVGGHA